MAAPIDPARFRLVALDSFGVPEEAIAQMPAELEAMNLRTAKFLQQTGYRAPFIGYVAAEGDCAVGGGAFVGPAAYGRVEIAYFTLPEHQGRAGVATLTARGLVAQARHADPTIALLAKTEPRESASSAILRRLGFSGPKETTDEEIGPAWAWRLDP